MAVTASRFLGQEKARLRCTSSSVFVIFWQLSRPAKPKMRRKWSFCCAIPLSASCLCDSGNFLPPDACSKTIYGQRRHILNWNRTNTAWLQKNESASSFAFFSLWYLTLATVTRVLQMVRRVMPPPSVAAKGVWSLGGHFRYCFVVVFASLELSLNDHDPIPGMSSQLEGFYFSYFIWRSYKTCPWGMIPWGIVHEAWFHEDLSMRHGPMRTYPWELGQFAVVAQRQPTTAERATGFSLKWWLSRQFEAKQQRLYHPHDSAVVCCNLPIHSRACLNSPTLRGLSCLHAPHGPFVLAPMNPMNPMHPMQPCTHALYASIVHYSILQLQWLFRSL